MYDQWPDDFGKKVTNKNCLNKIIEFSTNKNRIEEDSEFSDKEQKPYTQIVLASILVVCVAGIFFYTLYKFNTSKNLSK